MNSILTSLLLMGFIASIIGAAACWVATLIYGWKAIQNTRPGVRPWGSETMWNPANALMRPSLLTERGRMYQRKCLWAAAGFLVCVGVPLLIAALTGNIE